MNNDKTGGPAFPRAPFDVNDYTGDGAEGMTLRDYFAAKALLGLNTVQMFMHVGETAEEFETIIATRAYKVADAMLKAREA